MKGNDAIIQLLNEVLTAELTSVSQYFVDAKMASNWGYERLAQHFWDESIDEMKDADRLIERILYLEGQPNMQRLSRIRVGDTIPKKLDNALSLEREAIERLNTGVARCGELGDNGTRDVLETILHGEERHADWLETQLSLIEQVGEQLYLADLIRS